MKTIRFIIAAIVALCVTSCNHKDLCYYHHHTTKVTVVYDWSYADSAQVDGMCVYFYSMDDENQSYRFDFAGMKGGDIEIPAGRYRLITYNNDTELTQFAGIGRYDDHIAYTRTGDLLEPMYGNGVSTSATTDNGERVVITPDALWGCHATDVVITEHGVSYVHHSMWTRAGNNETDGYNENGDQIITLYPEDMLCHYTFEVRNVDNAEHISRISAAISGMSPSMNLSTQTPDVEQVTLPVGAKTNPSVKKVTGSFLTFGNSPDNTARQKMSFYVVMDDGKKYSFKTDDNLDVTDQVQSAPDRRHVHIIIDGLKLPQPIDTGDGYIPTVDDWEVINEDLKI